MSIARCLTSSLLWAGQTSTQMPHPVQSSGATWIVIQRPGCSRSFHSLCWKPSGADATASGSNTFIRIEAWGQTSAHLAQSMQISGSQIGISRAMFRFSHRAVSVGNVPSGGNAETGRRSPSSAIMRAVTRRTKSGASSGTSAARRRSVVGAEGTGTSWSAASAWSTAAKFLVSTVSPRLPYVVTIASLIASIASSSGSRSVSAKKQVWRTVLMREPSPTASATP